MRGTNPKFQSSVFIHTIYCTIRLFCVGFDITDFKKWINENQWGLVSKGSNYILCSYSFYNFKWEDCNWLSLESKDSGIPWGFHSSSSWSCVFAALTNRNLLVWKWLLCALQFIYHTLLTIDNGLQKFCDAPSHKADVWLQNIWNTVHNFFYDTFLIFLIH